MAGNAVGAMKKEAKRHGLSLDEYEQRCRTEKWCTGCHAWHQRDEFDIDRSRGDGLASACREARRRWQRIPLDKQKPKGPRGGRHSEETRQRLRESARARGAGRPKGWKHTPESRAKMSATLRVRAVRGPAVHTYKDGKVAERRGLRFTPEYKRWRYDVFARDAFTCRHCGDDRGGNLVAHHVKSFASFPDLRLDVDNGLTLCRSCHDAHHKEHGYG